MSARSSRKSTLVYLLLIGLLTLPLLLSRRVLAEGTFIPAAGRVDIVYDAKRGTLYITDKRRDSAGNLISAVLRYHVPTSSFLSPIPVTGNLMGIDLSPDGDTLLVADLNYSADRIWVHEVNLKTETIRKAEFPRTDSYEGGTFAVAFGNDGAALVTSTFLGSGWTSMRRYDPRTGEVSALASVRQSTMVSPSADGSVIGFAESNISDGRWGRYRVVDGNIVRREWGNGTQWFNYEIGVSRGATQYALPTYNGTYIYDGAFAYQTIVGRYAGSQPIGVAYHPFEDKVYFAWANWYSDGYSPWVREHSTADFSVLRSFDFENHFDHPGNGAFKEGRLRIASDASYLFGTVEGGVRFVRIGDARPVARHQTVRTEEDTPVSLTLWATSPTSSIEYELVSQPAHGTLTGVVPNLTYTPNPDYYGVDSFQFRVSSGAAESNVAAVTVAIAPVDEPVNQPPTAVDDSATTAEDTAVVIDVLANDSDPEGNPLTLAAVRQGSAGDVKIVDGRAEYTPRANFVGTDHFTYAVSDGEGGSAFAVVTVTVTPVNDAPIAQLWQYGTAEDTPLDIQLRATDADGDPLTYTVVSPPSHGTLAGTPPHLTYTPDRDWSGTDTFTFKANDGQLDSNVATIYVTVRAVNDAPVAADDSYATDEDTRLAVAVPGVLANDSDAEGNPLTAELVQTAAHGTLSLNADGSFTYVPEPNWHGTDSFTYRARDSALASTAVTVRITVRPVADLPMAAADAYATDEDAPLAVSAPGVLGNDSDADADLLTAAAVSGPTHGTLALNADGSFTYTPAPNFSGTDSFTYRAAGGGGVSSPATVTLTVRPVNDSPVAAADEASTAKNTAVTINVLGNDTDVEGDTLTVTGVTAPRNGTAALLADGSVRYAPKKGWTGTDTFSYTVSDGNGGTATATVTVRVGGGKGGGGKGGGKGGK